MTKEREKFGSRLGFIMVSAGCAVGLGNVWKFPYLCGQNGGAIFVLLYLLCLLLLAAPILVCELSVGRASQKSSAKSFATLQRDGSRWHLTSTMCVIGNYILMAFYTSVCGWMLYYFVKFITGDFTPQMATDEIAAQFPEMLASPGIMTISTFAVIAVAFFICSRGVQKGVERITKWMMMALLGLMGVLMIHSLTLPGASEGLSFFFVPNVEAVEKIGLGTVIFNAMSQAFFTLSIGIGNMAIFGSYLKKDRSLTGEAAAITGLDTMVALMAGLIIIPACFAFSINPGAGPSLIFITMPNVFTQMTGGIAWGSLFFLFLVFAALSTIIAVFENIISFAIDLWGWSRKKTVAFNLVMLPLLSLPCIFGFNYLSGFQPLGDGSTVLDLEDFIVSYNLLPLGALIYLFFCTHKNGWGWENFMREVNEGNGLKFPAILRGWLTWFVPVLMVVIYLKGYYDTFAARGTGYLVTWMTFAVLLLAFIGYVCLGRKKTSE